MLGGIVGTGIVTHGQDTASSAPSTSNAVLRYREHVDVAVAGGGVAGVSAALAAARRGLKTAIIEKTIQMGGLATGGYVVWFSSLCDQQGRQVIYGIPEELLRASLKYGTGYVYGGFENKQARPPGTKGNFSTHFAPAAFALAIEELLVAAGVTIWYDTRVCSVVMKDAQITGIEVENKSGRGLITASCVIDATGDADIACWAGAPFEEVDHPPVSIGLEASYENLLKSVTQKNARPLNNYGGINFTSKSKEGDARFHGTNAREVTQFLLHSRKLMRKYYSEKQQALGEQGRHSIYPLVLPSIPQIRKSRRIKGRGSLNSANLGKNIADPVGLIANWWEKHPGEIWQIPYSSLLPQSVTGLLVAGRCHSTSGYGWEITRVIAGASHTGQIAGIAAALAVQNKIQPHELALAALQAELTRNGIPYRFDELGPVPVSTPNDKRSQ